MVTSSEAGAVRGEGGAVVEVSGAVVWSVAAADCEAGDAPETSSDGVGSRTSGEASRTADRESTVVLDGADVSNGARARTPASAGSRPVPPGSVVQRQARERKRR